VGVGARFDRLEDDDWHATFDIGVISAARCTRAAIPWLRRADWARVVNNISAHSVRRQSPNLVAYTAAKSRTHQLRQESVAHPRTQGPGKVVR
jgi:3-oxoacyl-[acyl-carrier protein] reductase